MTLTALSAAALQRTKVLTDASLHEAGDSELCVSATTTLHLICQSGGQVDHHEFGQRLLDEPPLRLSESTHKRAISVTEGP